MTEDDDESAGYREATRYERDAQRLGVLLQLPCLTFADVAEIMALSESTIRQLRAEGRGPRVFRIGRRVWISRAALDEWVSRLDEGDERST